MLSSYFSVFETCVVPLSRAIEHLHAPEKAFMIEHEDVFLTRIYLKKNICIHIKLESLVTANHQVMGLDKGVSS